MHVVASDTQLPSTHLIGVLGSQPFANDATPQVAAETAQWPAGGQADGATRFIETERTHGNTLTTVRTFSTEMRSCLGTWTRSTAKMLVS